MVAWAALLQMCLPDTSVASAPPVHPIALGSPIKLGKGPAKENSGIVRSRLRPDLFWMQNDSGDEPRIYPVHRDGSVYRSVREPNTPGVSIGGAINVDWEDITVDSEGHVIVADFGNNANDRRDLVLYYVNEPAPTAERTTVKKKVFFSYPDQTSFPAAQDRFNFDAEALFTIGTQVYILTKHRSDTRTTLYRLDDPKPEVTNVLTRVDSFDAGGTVTAADATADGRKLVVTTYDRIWLFEIDNPGQSFFDGKVSVVAYSAGDVEAICFADDDTLLLGDEAKGVLYQVPLSVFGQAAAP